MPDIKEALAAAASAVTGSGTPEAVRVVQCDDRFTVRMRNLAGPAISLMVAGIVALLTWGTRFDLWTAASEETRATFVGSIGVTLALVLGVVIWTLVAGRPSSLEINAGPVGSLKIENDGGAE